MSHLFIEPLKHAQHDQLALINFILNAFASAHMLRCEKKNLFSTLNFTGKIFSSSSITLDHIFFRNKFLNLKNSLVK